MNPHGNTNPFARSKCYPCDRPHTNDQQPTTNNQQPATSNQQPATSNQQPKRKGPDSRRGPSLTASPCGNLPEQIPLLDQLLSRLTVSTRKVVASEPSVEPTRRTLTFLPLYALTL